MKAPDFLDDCGTLLAHVVDVLVMLVTGLSHVVVVLVIVITLLAHVVDVLVILAQLSKSQPDRPPVVRGWSCSCGVRANSPVIHQHQTSS